MEFTAKETEDAVSKNEKEKNSGKKLQLIIFKLGNEEYGLTIDQIKEVVLTPNIAQVPRMPSYIKGVANIRGNIIAILDLEERFGLKGENQSKSEQAGNYSLVIESNTFKVGILVKEVPNTLSIMSDDIDDAKGFIQFSSIDENCITGIVKSGERLIILVDVFKIMAIDNITNATITKEN